jgi:DNA-binding NtrC family response regulator
MKILIVDDNEAILFILESMLKSEGYEVETARDGEDGYAAYLVFNPDLVITDIQMPRENGFELMKHIRSHNPGMKTVYISAEPHLYQDALEEERVRYPVRFLGKPFSMTELIDSLKEQWGPSL